MMISAKDIQKKVDWKDLTRLTVKEMMIENMLTIPWFCLSMTFAYFEYYLLAIPFSILFFLAGMRQTHNGVHRSLGTSTFLTWLSLYINSILLVSSIHAVKFNHIRHHKYCLKENDYEGKASTMTWYEAIFYGPVHTFLIHWTAWKLGGRKYRFYLLLELTSIVLLIFTAIYFNIQFLIYHIILMVLSEFMMAFFAVWVVHHDTHESPEFARTQRTGWKNLLTMDMFYHLEHHLFPAVPTIKLPELAKRIDKAVPEFEKKETF